MFWYFYEYAALVTAFKMHYNKHSGLMIGSHEKFSLFNTILSKNKRLSPAQNNYQFLHFQLMSKNSDDCFYAADLGLGSVINSSSYDSKLVEAIVHQLWDAEDCFKPSEKNESYCILQPPPKEV